MDNNLLKSFEFVKASPIWVKSGEGKNEWVSFADKFSYESGRVKINISCETRYFLYINGSVSVRDGGLFAPDSAHAYVDTVDVTPFVKKGVNVIEILCWHYGNGGRNNVKKPQGFVIYECGEVNLYSGEHTECVRDGRFFESEEGEQPSFLYGGFNICYDARKERGVYGKSAVIEEKTHYLNRPIPMLVNTVFKDVKYIKDGHKYTVRLP